MKKIVPFLLVVAPFLSAACGVTTTCDDVLCYVPATVKLHLIDDVTGQPATSTNADFSVAGKPVGAACLNPQPSGQCDTWQLWLYGPTTLHIAPAGYQPADVMTDVERGLGNNSCCPPLPANPVEMAVHLTK